MLPYFAFGSPPYSRLVGEFRRRLLELDGRYQLNSRGEHDAREDYLHIDTTNMSPEEVAERAIERFGLAASA